ncbi:S-layer homology domain-containing protein [Acidaminobacterium chupaoyuni]
MSKKLRFLAAALCICLTTALLPTTASAAQYSDIKGHWAQATIERWSESGILNGYPDGSFRPNDKVTRGQLASILYRIWGAKPIEGFSYPDLPKSSWCYDSLTTMNQYGVALNTDDMIEPDAPLPREEAFYMIAKAFSVGIESDTRYDAYINHVSDFDQVSDFFTGRIFEMLHSGFVHGMSDGNLHPKQSITRAEVMTVLNNMFDLYVSKPGTYHLTAGESVLITCSDVTIILDKVENTTKYQSTIAYPMVNADGGVTFSNPNADVKASVTVHSVSQNEPTWKVKGNCSVGASARWVLSTRSLPDARFTAGFGRAAYPYMISTAEQLRLLTEFNDSLSAQIYFKLATDLNLGGLQEPLDRTSGNFVRANLDGGGHTITYNMTNSSYLNSGAGLFLGWAGKCSNLTVAGTMDLAVKAAALQNAENKNLYFGGFAAYCDRQFDNCTSRMNMNIRYEGTSEAVLNVGGLIGSARPCRMQNCLALGKIQVTLPTGQNNAYVGGLIGSSACLPFGSSIIGSKLSGCGADGSVSVQGGSHTNAGGLIGILTYLGTTPPTGKPSADIVENCWSTATIASKGAGLQSDCGGIAGHIKYGKIATSWAKPTISIANSALPNIGGIAGACYEDGSITDCWANAASCGSGGSLHTGGIVGRLAGRLSNCYAIGAKALGGENAIAFAQWNDGSVTASVDLTNQSAAQKQAFYKSCGWDFLSVWDQSGTNPILRSCSAANQRAAQS